jgi:hypothetical protein
MVGCLVEGTDVSQRNSLSTVTSGYVTPEDHTKPSSNSLKTKRTQPSNVNTLTLELAKPLSPLYDVMKRLFVCLKKKLFCLMRRGSRFAQLALSEQPSHVSLPKACVCLSDSYRMSRGKYMSATKDLFKNNKLTVTFKTDPAGIRG